MTIKRQAKRNADEPEPQTEPKTPRENRKLGRQCLEPILKKMASGREADSKASFYHLWIIALSEKDTTAMKQKDTREGNHPGWREIGVWPLKDSLNTRQNDVTCVQASRHLIENDVFKEKENSTCIQTGKTNRLPERVESHASLGQLCCIFSFQKIQPTHRSERRRSWPKGGDLRRRRPQAEDTCSSC